MKTRNRQIAMQRAIQLASQLQEGINPSHRTTQKRITIQQAADEFLSNLKTERRRKRTSIKYKGQFKKFIAFAATQGISGMNKVDLSLIDRYRGARVSEISERTLSNDGRALKTFLGWSAKRHLIPTNPLADTNFSRPKYQPRGGPTLEQINQILEIASPGLMPVIAVLTFTGRRSSEIEHLHRQILTLLATGFISFRVPMHQPNRAIRERFRCIRGSDKFSNVCRSQMEICSSLRHQACNSHLVETISI